MDGKVLPSKICIRRPALPSFAVAIESDSHIECIEQDPQRQAAFMQSAAAAQLVYAEGVQNVEAANRLAEATGAAPTFVAFDCAPQLNALSRLGGLPSNNPGCGTLHPNSHVDHTTLSHNRLQSKLSAIGGLLCMRQMTKGLFLKMCRNHV